MFFRWHLFGSVPDGVFSCSMPFLWAFGVPRGDNFSRFLNQDTVFCEKVTPSFLFTIIAGWLDFQGPGFLESSKNEKKQFLTNQRFFDVKKGNPNWFVHFQDAFWGYFREPLGDFKVPFSGLFWGGSPGPLRDHFWVYFWAIGCCFGSHFGIVFVAHLLYLLALVWYFSL